MSDPTYVKGALVIRNGSESYNVKVQFPTDNFPIGVILPFLGTTPPENWVMGGITVDQNLYPDLYNLTGAQAPSGKDVGLTTNIIIKAK